MELINKLIKLKQDNPELEIIPIVDDDVCSGECSWSQGSIQSVEKTVFCMVGDYFYLGADEALEQITEIIEEENEGLINKDIPLEIEKRYKEKVKEIICIKIGLP